MKETLDMVLFVNVFVAALDMGMQRRFLPKIILHGHGMASEGWQRTSTAFLEGRFIDLLALPLVDVH